MEYTLKNGRNVTVRKPTLQDADSIIHIISTADTQSPFLARNPGEFTVTTEREAQIISGVLADNDSTWYVAEYDGKLVGQCSVGLIRRNQRYRHRAEVALVLLKEYWGLGIGGRMMNECISWCLDHGIEQLELDVISNNERAISMYSSFGFEIIGKTPNALCYPDSTYADEYRMIKMIQPAPHE